MIGIGAHRPALAILWAFLLLGGVFGQAERVSEVLVGDTGVGLQKLQWQVVTAGSERVRRGGSLLVSGKDYHFNPELGYLRFEPPLAPGETATIEYEIVRGRSAKQSGRTLLPMEAEFLSTSAMRLGLVAQMRDDLAGFLGIRGSYRSAGGWRWSSGYYLSEHDPSASRSSMIQMGVDGVLLGGSLRASFVSAGEQFLAAKALGARAASEVLTAEWKSGGSRASGYAAFREEEAAYGQQRASYGAGFDLRLDPALTFAASRAVKTEGGRARTEDRIDLSFTPDDLVTFGVGWSGEIGSGGKTRVTFEADDPIASLNASHEAPDSGGPGETSVTGSARLTRSLRVEASAVAEGDTAAADTKLWWQPVSRIGLAGTYFAGSGAPFSEAAGVELRWSPLLPLELSGMGRRRVSPEKGEPVDTLVMRATSKPHRGITLRAEYADRPEDKLGLPEEVRRRSAGADIALGSLTLGGTYSESVPIGGIAERRKLELQSGVFFSRSTSFQVIYAEEGLFSSSLTGYRSYGIGLHSSRGSFLLSLEGRMKDYYDHGSLLRDRRDYEAKASFGMRF